MTKVHPLDVQVGGAHYKNLRIQPTQLAYKLNTSPSFKDVAKYITRIKEGTPREQDIQKAIHFIQLERELIEDEHRYGYNVMQPNAHKWIKDFSEQFGNESEIIYSILWALFNEQYDTAEAAAQLFLQDIQLIEKV